MAESAELVQARELAARGCGKYKRCDACATKPHCGWCAATQKCVRGSGVPNQPYTPLPKECPIPDTWAWAPAKCAEANCLAAGRETVTSETSKCSSCAARKGCGWCGNVATGEPNKCMPSAPRPNVYPMPGFTCASDFHNVVADCP